jgi:hypothetical protein
MNHEKSFLSWKQRLKIYGLLDTVETWQEIHPFISMFLSYNFLYKIFKKISDSK